jgi:hypothetical protein
MEFKKTHFAQNFLGALERDQATDIILSSGLGVFFLARISGDVKGTSFPSLPQPRPVARQSRWRRHTADGFAVCGRTPRLQLNSLCARQILH